METTKPQTLFIPAANYQPMSEVLSRNASELAKKLVEWLRWYETSERAGFVLSTLRGYAYAPGVTGRIDLALRSRQLAHLANEADDWHTGLQQSFEQQAEQLILAIAAAHREAEEKAKAAK